MRERSYEVRERSYEGAALVAVVERVVVADPVEQSRGVQDGVVVLQEAAEAAVLAVDCGLEQAVAAYARRVNWVWGRHEVRAQSLVDEDHVLDGEHPGESGRSWQRLKRICWRRRGLCVYPDAPAGLHLFDDRPGGLPGCAVDALVGIIDLDSPIDELEDHGFGVEAGALRYTVDGCLATHGVGTVASREAARTIMWEWLGVSDDAAWPWLDRSRAGGLSQAEIDEPVSHCEVMGVGFVFESAVIIFLLA